VAGGFGLAANNVTVKIEKFGEGGWFYILPLEYDGFVQDEGRPSPTIEWRGPSSLEIRVYTRDISGTLMRRDQELTVVRSYVAKEPT
jgi:hypothetical protein